MTQSPPQPRDDAHPLPPPAQTGPLAVLTWDWHQILLQIAHRGSSLGWVLFAAGVVIKAKTIGCDAIALAAAVAVLSVLSGLLAWLVVPPVATDKRQAIGVCVFSIILFLALAIFCIATHVPLGAALRGWLAYAFSGTPSRLTALFLVFVIPAWIVAAWFFGPRPLNPQPASAHSTLT